ncbi:MAG: SEL1-like repeat protein [Planctomycetales bacterium]|nr:SEL1-like repeat protein [Planctomycetales bacterium]
MKSALRTLSILNAALLTSTAFAQLTTGGSVDRTRTESPAWPELRVHALCIGIDDFGSDAITRLELPEKETTDFANLLREDYAYEVETLLGKEATKTAIETKIKTYVKELGTDDALIVYFATHGNSIPDGHAMLGYLVPYGAPLSMTPSKLPSTGPTAEKPKNPTAENAEKWAKHAIGMRWLQEQARAMKTRHVLFLIDACCSGMIGKRGDSTREDLQALIRLRSRAGITAGTEEQAAIGGIFTPALIDGLKQPGAKSVTELFVRVRERVVTASGNSMLPQLREIETQNGEFVFVPHELVNDRAKLSRAIEASSKRRVEIRGQTIQLEEVIEAFDASDYRFAIDRVAREQYWQRKLTRFREHASAGYPLGMAGAYYCYSRGLGTDIDTDTAYAWARRAYQTGDNAGIHVFAACLWRGDGVGRNPILARKLFNEAAAAGFPLSKHTLAMFLREEGQSRALSPHEQRRMLSLFREAADASVVWSQGFLAEVLITGTGGVPIDLVSGIGYLKQAANNGSPSSMRYLCEFYHSAVQGDLPKVLVPLIPPNEEDGRNLLQAAAEAGYSRAQLNLGDALLKGTLGFRRDTAQAIEWLELAGRQGEGGALSALAELYGMGIGVPKNIPKAAGYLEQAVELNSRFAVLMKADWLSRGIHYPPDREAALPLYVRAGDLGVPFGFLAAGKIYLGRYENKVDRRVDPQTGMVSRYIAAGAREGVLAAKYLIKARESAKKSSLLDEAKLAAFMSEVQEGLSLLKHDMPEFIEIAEREIASEAKP